MEGRGNRGLGARYWSDPSASGKCGRRASRSRVVAITLMLCVECGKSSNEAAGWRVVRIDDPEDEDARPELGWYCPRSEERV